MNAFYSINIIVFIFKCLVKQLIAVFFRFIKKCSLLFSISVSNHGNYFARIMRSVDLTKFWQTKHIQWEWDTNTFIPNFIRLNESERWYYYYSKNYFPHKYLIDWHLTELIFVGAKVTNTGRIRCGNECSFIFSIGKNAKFLNKYRWKW